MNLHLHNFSFKFNTLSTPTCKAISLWERAHSWSCNIFIGPSGNGGYGHSNSIIAS